MESYCLYMGGGAGGVAGGVLHLSLTIAGPVLLTFILQAITVLSRRQCHSVSIREYFLYPMFTVENLLKSDQSNSYWKQTEMLCTALCGSPILNQAGHLPSLVHVQAADGC